MENITDKLPYPSEVEKADFMMRAGQIYEAQERLEETISNMPSDWKPITESESSKDIAFWNISEFKSHTKYQKENHLEETIKWATPSYSKAFYFLAYLAVEHQDWPTATEYIDQAIALEPDHPLLLCEKALILNTTKHHAEAYDLYIKAADIRPWAPASQRAKALRGAGVALVNLGKIDEAEEILKKSLKLEPDSFGAKHELAYIEQLREMKGAPTDEYVLHKYTK